MGFVYHVRPMYMCTAPGFPSLFAHIHTLFCLATSSFPLRLANTYCARVLGSVFFITISIKVHNVHVEQRAASKRHAVRH